MKPVMVALYDDFGIADRVRTALVAKGFPTDRVEVTSQHEAGQADAEPGDSYRKRIANYFHTIFDQAGSQESAELFAERVRQGKSAVTVHPRTDYEMTDARAILRQHNPVEFREHTAPA